MSIFTPEAVQIVSVQFRSHLNWLRTLLHFMLHCILSCTVLY